MPAVTTCYVTDELRPDGQLLRSCVRSGKQSAELSLGQVAAIDVDTIESIDNVRPELLGHGVWRKRRGRAYGDTSVLWTLSCH